MSTAHDEGAQAAKPPLHSVKVLGLAVVASARCCRPVIRLLLLVVFVEVRDARAARGMWERFESERQHTYWMKPLLLVALGNYVDQCQRTYLDSAGAMKLRPRTAAEKARA